MSEVRAFFDRWQRLEKAKAEISEDLKELFAEAKATGFNTKAMRVAFRAKVKAENETDDDRELAAIVDLYLAEIDGPRARPASARVENIEEIGAEINRQIASGELVAVAHDAETGEITEQPETAPQSESVHEARSTSVEHVAGESSTTNPNPQEPTSSPVKADSPASTQRAKPGTNPEDFHPGSLWLAKPKTAADYRPHCLHPEACGSSGLHHCYSCEKALERESEAA